MAFTKKTWVNVPDPSNLPSIPGGQDALARFDAENMNRIEKGIEEAHTSKAPSGHGLGDRSEPTQNITLESIMEMGCGFYQVNKAADTPANEASWINLIQSSRGTTDGKSTGVQIAAYDWYKNKPQMWFRTLLLGEKSNWVELIHTGNAVGELSKLGMVRFASGSYVGTGTYGTANPISIPVPFKPRLMIIGNQESARNNKIYGENWFGSGEYTHYNGGDEYIKYVNGNVMIYAHGSTNGAALQHNISGETYRWYIFG